eukprot:Nk52_evm99s151 gene=Nk52_evmTU99s151
MSSSCSGLKQELIDCVGESKCFKVEKKGFRECLQEGEDIGEECRAIYVAYMRCRRTQIDMRARFRGNKGY